MKPSIRTRLAISVAALALVAAACGSDDSSDSTTAPAATSVAATPTTAAATATTAAAPTATDDDSDSGYGESPTTAAAETSAPAADGVSVEVSDTSLGKVLTSDGITLYIFTPDAAGTPTCVGGCAGAWPPLLGSAGAAGSGVEADDITVVDRPDGTKQLAYFGWPLYFYAEDQVAGDVTGQGSGGKWYVIGADGTPIETAAG